MSLLRAALGTAATLTVLALVGRAGFLLLRDPETPHGQLVSRRERWATTALGVPLTLVGASTLVNGPLAVSLDPLVLLLPGIVLLVYPDFTPSSLG